MNVIDHPSPNHSPRDAGVRVDTVLLHHTATKFSGPALQWLCDPRSKVSAHYIVGRLGNIWRLVPEDRKAGHAGKGRLPWETCEPYDFNHRSIGVEVVNPGDGVTPFTEAQYHALEWLVPEIVRRLGDVVAVRSDPRTFLPADAARDRRVYVLGHRDVAPGRKVDPADNFDWGRIRKSLARGAA